MNRAKLIVHLLRNGCILLREGAKHSIYRNLFTGAQTTVPRHKTLLVSTARGICRQLGVSWPQK
ncbi:MAG: type II toxin-antitoxin system HicA family toxin [Patescibacteria group bacterium]